MLVRVVFDLENDDTPFPIGTYYRTDEEIVFYIAPDGSYRTAPEDCVAVVSVEVPRA